MSAPYDDNNPAATPPTLRRQFGLREAITITVGTVIGVGLFTTGGNIVGLMGPAVIIATLVAMLVSIYPALLYAEMGAALPYAGGTYQYAGLGLGRPLGMLAGWNFIISLVAVTGGESLAFAYYFKTVFLAIGIELPVPDVVLACIALVLFIVTNVRGVQITGRLQNGFMFFFWGVAVIWFLTMIPEVSLPTFVTAPTFLGSMDAFGFIAAVAMIWWCFAGFETCCGMGEEIRYPSINIPRALKLAPFIIFAVNGAFQWFLVGITPAEAIPGLAEAAAPYAEAMMSAGILGLPLLLLALGVAFGGDFSTLNASIAVPPRYLFTMARDGAMPRVFAKGAPALPHAVRGHHRARGAVHPARGHLHAGLHRVAVAVRRLVLLHHRHRGGFGTAPAHARSRPTLPRAGRGRGRARVYRHLRRHDEPAGYRAFGGGRCLVRDRPCGVLHLPEPLRQARAGIGG